MSNLKKKKKSSSNILNRLTAERKKKPERDQILKTVQLREILFNTLQIQLFVK